MQPAYGDNHGLYLQDEGGSGDGDVRSLRASCATKATGSSKPCPTLSTPFDLT